MTARSVAMTIEQVAVRFGGLVAISDMSFTVGEGEIVSLIGPNGAGKTTAFNVMTGFLTPSAGRVTYRDTALNGLKPHEIADLGLIRTFQRTSVFPNDTVYDNLLIGLHRQGRVRLLDAILGLPSARASERKLRQRASELIEWVGLERRAHDRGRLALLWRAASRRRRAGACGRAFDAAAGRAGLRHECLGDAPVRRADPQHS